MKNNIKEYFLLFPKFSILCLSELISIPIKKNIKDVIFHMIGPISWHEQNNVCLFLPIKELKNNKKP